MSTNTSTTLADFIWKNADDLRDHFRHTEFGKVLLPFTLLRRLECVLEPTREAVREAHAQYRDTKIDVDPILKRTAGTGFYNTSRYTLATLGATQTRPNLEDYLANFSDNARQIFEQFDLTNTLTKMDRAGILYRICQNFADIDLHPQDVPDRVMSNVYEHLIRRFGAAVNEAAEDFMTPRDVVHLATALVIQPDVEMFEQNEGVIRTLYDPTCGTAGFLTDAINYVHSLSHQQKALPRIVPYGQEVEPETHAVAMAGMLIRGEEASNIQLGSTLSDDRFPGKRFNYCLSNPPFGKDWGNEHSLIEDEHKRFGHAGRFGPGLPRKSDGSMLFLMHLASKMESVDNGGGRAAIVLSGSPLFNGGAGSGESEIRRHLLEEDLVDAIVALPTDIFFRTGIGTYLWILDNDKPAERQGKVQLIDATERHRPLRKNEGNKRREVGPDECDEILRRYDAFEDAKDTRVFDYTAFGYRRVKILRPLRKVLVIDAEDGLERLHAEKAWSKLTEAQQAAWTEKLTALDGQTLPYGWPDEAVAQATGDAAIPKAQKQFVNALRKAFEQDDPEGEPVRDTKGNLKADTSLTDYEHVPLGRDVRDYFTEEVMPHVPDAWIDETYTDESDNGIGKVGYEINFNRYFYEYTPPRPLDAIDADLDAVEAEIRAILDEVTG